MFLPLAACCIEEPPPIDDDPPPVCGAIAAPIVRTCQGDRWQEGVVDAAGGWNPALAIGPDGAPHLTYQHDRTLAHAARAGATWDIELVDEPTAAAWDTAIVLDACGGAHVLYSDFDAYDLRYGYRPAGGDWQVSVVDSERQVGWTVGLAIDPRGGLHAVYTDVGARAIRYAVKPSGVATWTTEQLAADAIEATIAVDKIGGVHVAYVRSSTLTYAQRPPDGEWAIDVIDVPAVEPAIAVEPGGRVHVVYFRYEAFELRHALRVGTGAWQIEALPGDTHGASDTTVTLDGEVLEVAYFDLAEDAIRATRAADGRWTSEVAAPFGGTPRGLALAVGHDGALHLAFYNSFHDQLHHATRCVRR